MTKNEFEKYINQPKFQVIIKDEVLRKEALSTKYEKYRNWILDTADKLIANKLIFNHKWDMERTHETFDYKDKIIWDHTPNGDDEFIYMKNRHRIWFIIAQAYYISKNEKYVIKLKEQIISWVEEDFTHTGIESKLNRQLDKGIRMENWIKVILLINDSPNFDHEIFNVMMGQIQEHAKDLDEYYPIEQVLSNHGLLQNQGLLMLTYYFGDQISIKNKLPHLIERVEENARLQILPDGIDWEQSPMYHSWVLYSFLQVRKYARLLNIELSNEYTEQIRKMAMGIIKFIKPNGHQPTQNDSDDTDAKDMITRAALELNDGILKTLSLDELDFDTLMDYGSDGLEKFKGIEKEEIPFVSIACHESGNYFMRSSWKENANYMTFRNGQYGSGHSHADVNNISVYANGVDWISNTGRYTYKEVDERIVLKDAKAHSTQIINGEGSTRIKDSWSFDRIARTFKLRPLIKDKFDYVSGTNLGFVFDKKPVVPLREVIFIKPDYWFVMDTFYGNDSNDYEVRFQIDKDIEITHDSSIINLKKEMKIFRIFNLFNLDTKIIKGQISKHYNQIEDSNIIVEKVTQQGITNIANVLDPSGKIIKIEKVVIKQSHGEIVADTQVNAWKITRQEGKTEILFFANGEITKGKKVYVVEGVKFYGKKAIIWFENDEYIKTEILEY